MTASETPQTPHPIETIGALFDRSVVAYEALGALGEEIEDEWQYVNDLVGAYRGRLLRLAEERGADEATPEAVAAIGAAIEEIQLISDPNRAIDWLSTFPQLVLFNLRTM